MEGGSTLRRVLLLLLLIITADVLQVLSDENEQKEKPANVQIKIVDSPASRISALPSTMKELTLRIQPANLSGPAHLKQLAGLCFKLTEGGYTYTVCPFHNVTQKEEHVAWNSFYGVLGVWREWIVENDTFVGMHFVKGQECSSGEREVKVLFNCSTMTLLHNVSEPTTCHYIVWMDTPLACFKGAMQVYHILSPEQLKEWDQLEYDYHADEITFQGLTKKRRKILTSAGLLFNQKREKQRQEAEEAKRQREREEEEKKSEEAIMPNPLLGTVVISPLTACEEERDKLRKELDDLTEKVRGIVKEFPAVAYKLGFIQNLTLAQKLPDTVTTSAPVISEETNEKEKKVDEEGEVGVAAADRGVEGRAGLTYEREEERERGGEEEENLNQHVEEAEDVHVENVIDELIREINKEAEEKDRLQLEGGGVDVAKLNLEHEREQVAVQTEGKRALERGVPDEQLQNLIEQLENEHPQ